MNDKDLLSLPLNEIDELFGNGEITREQAQSYCNAWNATPGRFTRARVEVNYINLVAKE